MLARRLSGASGRAHGIERIDLPGCLDVLYNLRHGKYRDLDAAMGAEAVINATSLGLGAFTAWALWRWRGELVDLANSP